MKITFLGTGTSTGVPVIGCRCAVCQSEDKKNHRTRPSIVITIGDKNILVDTAPELRLQAIRSCITHVDAILFTHIHADHILGLDDVRVYSMLQETMIPCYGSHATIEHICTFFHYVFKKREYANVTIPKLTPVTIDGPFQLFGLDVIPIDLLHGQMPVLGFRIENFAYVTDCSFIPPTSIERLQNLDLLVLEAIRWHPPHPTHFTIPEALEIVEQLQPKRCYFTHLTHEVEHDSTNARLPDHVQLAYDGLVVAV